jgi:thiol:disulfide interchange protein
MGRLSLLFLALLTCCALSSFAVAGEPASTEKPKPPADVIFQNGLASMRSSTKAGFFNVSAPGCIWCRRMDQLFSSGEAAEVLRKYYVYIAVDVVNNPGTADLAKRFGRNEDEGTPWFAVIDADGKALMASNASGENIGFPGNDKERAAFLAIVRATAQGITPEEVAIIENGLKGAVAKPAKK